MIVGRKQQANARAVLLAAFNRFGMRMFRVDVCGANYRPLKDAEWLGWVWFTDDGGRCAITQAGQDALQGFIIRPEPRALVSYVCPVCLGTVMEPDRGDGLPEDTACPHCAERTQASIQRLKETM